MDKIVLYFFVISILMMYNDAFFTLLGQNTGIVFWRQLVTLISYVVLLKYLPQISGHCRFGSYRVLLSYKKLFIYIGFASIISIVINGFGCFRVFYAVTEYAFPIPFIIFPFVAKKCGWSRSSLNRFFIFIGLFLSTGLIADFLSGGFFTKACVLSVTQEFESFESGRYNFLSTSNSIFTVYYSLCVMSCFREYHNSNKSITKIVVLLISFYCIFASIFCGARQTLVGLLIVEGLGLLSIMKSSAINVFIFLLATIGVYVVLPSAQNMIMSNSAFDDRYTAEAIKEDNRTDTWKQGLNYCLLNPTLQRALIGDGVSYVIAMKAGAGEKKGKHFENTFFSRISELGIIAGIISLLIPVSYFWKYRKRSKYWLLYLSVILSYLFICFISPNGGSGQTQMSILILLALYFDDLGLDS